MKDLLTYIAQNLVEHPQAVDVQETETDGNVVLELRVDPSDMGKVIGRQGRIAKEIRTLMRSVAQRQKGFRRNYGLKNGGAFCVRHFFMEKEGVALKHRYLEAGKIVNTHGIAGEVKILPWADDPAFLLDFDTLYIDGQPVSLLGARVHKNCVLAKLAGIHDINEAMKLKNKVVFIDREDAELEEGAFFLADLMGLEVRDADSGEVLGQIADILTPPASNVYVVTGGKQDHMIPAVPEFIVETNIDEGYLRVRLIEGM